MYAVINLETGNVIEDVLPDRSKDRWEKIYLDTFTLFMTLSDSKSAEVLLWILNNKDSLNKVYTTLDLIATSCSTSKVTVSKTFTKLYATGLLKKIRNGVYILNPQVMSNGSEAVIANITKEWLNTE